MTDNWRTNARDAVPEGDARPRIESHPECDGVRLVDPIEKTEFTLLTPEPVIPVEEDTSGFYFPVETAASIDTAEIKTPYKVDVLIRDSDGELVATSEDGEIVSVSSGQYNLDISSAQLKIYLAINGSITVNSRREQVTIASREAEQIQIGVRSFHEQPEATITTTDEPEDLMKAISTFGSALKIDNCERSYPTLRGHPPLLEIGDVVDIPNSINVPETGISLRVPPQYDYLYPITSLVYYLGATVEPGDSPMLIVEGESVPLGPKKEFEKKVERILKQIFILDCVTRTEGYYQIDLEEREIVEDALDLDFEALYQVGLAEQIQSYLSIPYEAIADAIPKWKLTAEVPPEPDHCKVLPFLANELAIIRCPAPEDINQSSPDSTSVQVRDFFDAIETNERAVFQRTNSAQNPTRPTVFQPPPADSFEQTYIGDGAPLGAGKMSIRAYYERIRQNISENNNTKIAVVCNDQAMIAENTVSRIYRDSWIDCEVSILSDLTKRELELLLEKNIDFLHYIGHVDSAGIKCSDEHLDTKSIQTVNVKSFLLNACTSYQQGKGLVTGGARGGVTTVSKVADENGVKFGKTFAELLSKGFPLGQTLNIISEVDRDIDYIVIGDSATQVFECKDGVPVVYRASKVGEDEYEVNINCQFTTEYGLGSITNSLATESSNRRLCGNVSDWFTMNKDEFTEIVTNENSVVLLDGELLYMESEPI